MTNFPSDHDVSVTLRAATELREQPPERPAAGAAASQQPDSSGDDDVNLVIAGVALLACAGWLIDRRRHLAQRAPVPANVVAADAAPANASSFEPGPDSAMQSLPAPVLADREPAEATWVSMPQELPQKRLLGVAGQKRLIKVLMWLRTAAGGAAILAAIAIVVFWSIDTTDRRAGETGLNAPLLVLLLGGWAAFWLAGRIANMLHRAFFGRVHPKFDN